MLSTYNYFTLYFIQLTFISVGNWMLDLVHLVQVKFFKWMHKRKQRRYRRYLTFVDNVPFEFAPHASIVCTTYAIAFLFSITVPYVTIFSVPFFMMKYYVDKYNLTFCYESQQHGKGVIAYKLLPLTVFSIMFSQVLNASILTARLPGKRETYIKFAIAVIVIELGCILIY
jgi:hypothetical protein